MREFWVHVSDPDEDSDSSDDDDTNKGGRKQRGLFRVVNPPPDGYVSDSSADDGGDGCALKIYPGPDHEHYRYHHAHLRYFS